ncbi:UNVERIFIED_CONTAM: hypothetical protein Sradi_2007000 [Sesamum radiatum]|uniref:Uncharacterized protein n=1 Tax=Sesamum radiatum TaxID=300843 RepID=A0AAW2TGF7_SESRA
MSRGENCRKWVRDSGHSGGVNCGAIRHGGYTKGGCCSVPFHIPWSAVALKLADQDSRAIKDKEAWVITGIIDGELGAEETTTLY